MSVPNGPNIFKDNYATPVFIHISFSESPNQVAVSRQLWPAWTYLQSDNPPTSRMLLVDPSTGSMRPAGDVGSFVKEGMRRTAEETAKLPQNPDEDSVHTEWRDKVYHFWNHVFHDVANWLQINHKVPASMDGIGHFHPPNSEALGLHFPTEASPNPVSFKKWDQDVLLIPAHLKKDVKIRVVATYDNEPGQVIDTGEFMYDSSTTTDICYIRRGVEVKLYIEGDFDKSCSGTAAVLVCGVMCSESHDPDDPPGRPEQKALTEGETREMETQAEVQSSMQMAFAMYRQSQVEKMAHGEVSGGRED